MRAYNQKQFPDRSEEAIKHSIEGAFFGEFSRAMLAKGSRLARSLAPREKQKLMDAGRRYDDIKRFETLEDENKDLKAWIKKEGRQKAIDMSMGNIEKRILETDQKIIMNPQKGGIPLEGDLSKVSLLPNDSAYSLAYERMEQCRKQLQSADTAKKKNELATEYLVAKHICDQIGHGEGSQSFPAYKVNAMRKEIRKDIVGPMQAEKLSNDKLISKLDAPERTKEVNRLNAIRFSQYITLHTGENAKNSPDEKVEDLAK